jgi:hypothetical protein
MTKMCSKCHQEKPITEFAFKNKEKNTLQSLCNPCRKTQAKLQYEKNKSSVIDSVRIRNAHYKSLVDSWKQLLQCVCCGEDDPVTLDFHHTNGADKEFAPAKIKQQPKLFMAEMSKCVCVCSNCHRKIHANKILVTATHIDKFKEQLTLFKWKSFSSTNKTL